MTVDELKANLEKYREGLKERAGGVVTSSENGPIGMEPIEAILATLEPLEQRVEKVEQPMGAGQANLERRLEKLERSQGLQ